MPRLSTLAGLTALAAVVLAEPQRLSKRSGPSYVFAHFMIGNTNSYSGASDYVNDINLAKAAGIDGFALNIANEDWDDTQLSYVYTAANSVGGFKLFISFDFAVHGFSSDWSSTIVPRLKTYAVNGAAAKIGSAALVSSFAGDGFNWSGVRSAVGTSLYIVPAYGPGSLSGESIDGAFQWNAWPSSNNQPVNQPMNTDGDKYYQSQLSAAGLSTYMAGVSPWFFTHYGPNSYNKNWLYLSDTLLIDRLNEMYTVQPQLIEIITWNDFGESSYVGPLHPNNPAVYPPNGQSPGAIDWVTNMPHDGWRDILKVYIPALKAGDSVNNHITKEEIVYWYRPHTKGTSCSDSIGQPTGNSYPADAVWVSTILKSSATLSVTSGGQTTTFNAPAGVNYFSAPFPAVGTAPSFSLSRPGSNNFLSGTGELTISGSCNVYNYNAYVGVIA